VEPERLGCNVGAGLICTDLDELGMAVNTAVVDGKFDLKTWGEQGIENLTPLWLLKYLPNMLACHVTIIHGCEGPSNNITCGDASAHLSVGESAGWIARGEADVVIAGGAESKLNPMGVLRQSLLGRLRTGANDTPETACRPFDADAAGTVVGEGGGLLVLEDADRAERRGVQPYAELAGFAAACDPEGIDVTRPNVGSLDMAVRKALAAAGAGPDDVDAIICQGSGVPGEDRLEAEAWAAALGETARRAPAFALSGATGTLFAGTGGAALAAAAVAVRRGVVPPTVNFSRPGEGVMLNLSGAARRGELNCVVTGAYSIGGQSAACVLKRAEG
ncbi:MAG: beta-ketoacyl synthase N-terminal-like domain-containing protein, partial [Planctomycetota bacterium]